MRTIKSGLFGLILLVVVASALFLTCDVGLGHSVDTKPPTVTITYPPVQSVIKNAFTMSGAASDDTALASVSVGVVNTITAATYGPYAATIDTTQNAWSLMVNNYNDSGYELRDGTYEMTVTAIDGAGRKSVATTTYEIDNTAPVVVIDRPGSFGPISESNPGETYGTELKLTGSINDDHAIEKLVFTAYDTTGKVVGSPITQANISGVAMDITLAKFFSAPANADEVALNNLYNTIYTGYDSATGKYNTLDYYCTITASDSAREFNPPAARASADNTRGNVNSSYYLYADIYSQIFAATGYAVTMKDLTAMFNGSYADTAKAQAVLGVLASKAHPAATWSTGSASFSLNPTNSPSYEVKGFTSISSSNPIDGMKKTNGTDLTIIVKAGRDGVPLLPATFKVYLDPCGSSGSTPTETAGVDDIVLLDTVAALGDGSVAANARNAKITKSGTDYSIFVNIGSIATKTNYRLHVLGSDQNGKALEEQNYGFRVITNGKPPAVTIGSALPADQPDPTPLNVSTINKTSVTCIGYVTCETGLKSLPATVTVLNTTTNTIVATHTVDLSSVGQALAATKWTLPIDTGADTATVGLYQYTVALTATDEEGNSTAATRIFYIDREPPKVEFNLPTPVVNVSGTNKVNGLITYSGRVTDNYGVYSASYSLDGGTTFIPIANPISWTTADIDTRNFDDPTGIGTLNLLISMTDKAGNTALASTFIDIDQSTDKPVITLTNANIDGLITDPAKVDKDHNLFGTLTNNTIYGTVKDDDKLGSKITVKIDGSDADVAQITGIPSGSTYAINYVPTKSGKPLSEGIHTIEFIAADEYDLTSTTSVFQIGIDEAAPTLEITSPAQGAYCSGKLIVTGTASDGSGVVNIVGTDPVITTPAVDADHKWQEDVIVGATTGAYKRLYTATDKYGRTTSVTLNYSIDTTPPELTVSTPGDTNPKDSVPDAMYIKAENAYQIVGGASDVGSAVAEVRYQIYPVATAAPTVPAADWPVAVNTTNWTANLNLSDDTAYPAGAYKVYCAAKDRAGNPSAITTASTVTLFVDRSDPVLNVPTLPAAYVHGDITISGTATDPDGNLDAATSVTYTRTAQNNTANSQASKALPLTGNNWEISDTGLNDDTYTYTITATDKAGHKATWPLITVVKDTTSPTIEISSITKQLTANSKDNNVNGTITVKGTISDNDKVSSGTYILKTGSGTDTSAFTAVTSSATVTETGTLTSWSFTVDTKALADKTNLAISVSATDRAGNPATKDSSIVYIDQSTDKPVITLTNALVGVKDASGVNATTNLFGTTSNNKILGTITDDDALGTSVVVMIDGDVAKSMAITNTAVPYSVEYIPAKADNALLSEGKHSIEIIAHDSANVETTTGVFWIGIDAGDPSIAVTSPAQNGYYSGTIAVGGTAKDGSGIATVVRVGDSAKTNLYAAGTWSDSLAVGSATGTFTTTYEATDIYGRTKTADFTYNVDATPPTLSVETPGDADKDGKPDATFIKAENVYQVTGKAGDDSGTVSAVVYLVVPYTTTTPAIDASWLTAVGTGVWTANVNLSDKAEGDYSVFIASKDRASNYSTVASVLLHADKTLPVLNPQGAAVLYVNDDAEIGYTVTETNLDTVTYTRKANSVGTSGSGSLALTSGVWSVKDTGLTADTYTYTITAKDKAGHEATNTVQLVKDVSPPTIVVNSITKQLSANGRSDNVNGKITVKGTITDNDKVATGTYTLNSNGTNVAGYIDQSVDASNLMNWSFDVDTTVAGILDGKDLTITINATDRANNKATPVPMTVHVDQSTDKPVVTMSVPAYVGKNYVVTGTVTDDDEVDESKLTINYYNGTAWLATPLVIKDAGGTVSGTPTDKTFSYTLPDLGADGVKQIVVNACDTITTNDTITLEPVSNGPVSVTVDTADPIISIDTPAVDDTSAASGIVIKGTVKEIGLKSLTVSIDGKTPEVLKTNVGGAIDFSYSPIFAALTDGRHTAVFEAVPQYGKTVTEQRTFFKDKTGPMITFSNLTAGADPASAILDPDTIRGTVSDSGSAVKTNFDYRFDTDPAGEWRHDGLVSGTTWSVNIPADLVETDETNTAKDPLKGPVAHTITVQFWDVLDNTTISTDMKFRFDRYNPKIDFTAPSKTVYNENFTLKCSSSDSNGVATTKYYVDNVSIGSIVNDTPFTIDTSKQDSGSHTVKIAATDKVGRTEQAVFSYILDKKLPEVKITGISPLADGTKINRTVTIGASGTDENGIAEYAYATTLDSVDDYSTIAVGDWKVFAVNSTTMPFDTTDGNHNTWEKKTCRIWVRAQDKAGNYGYAHEDHVVDQDSDKPIVKLTNLATTGSPTLVQTKSIYGTISDDDGAVTSLMIKTSESDSWTSVTLDGQSFIYPVTGSDGGKQLYFQITDNAKTIFTTALASSTTTPRLYQGVILGVDTYLETPLLFNLDTTPPDIGSDSIGIKVSGSSVYSAYSSTNAYYGGAASGMFDVQFMASSANTVASASVLITDSALGTKTVDATLGAPVSVTVDADTEIFTASGAHGLTKDARVFFIGTTLPGGISANVPYYVISTGLTLTDFEVSATLGGPAVNISSAGTAVNFTTGWTTKSPIDISKLANGAATLSITTKDTPGLTTTTSKTILIDNVKPSISVTSHKMNDQVTGDVVFNGTSDDATGSGVTFVKYHVGTCDPNATSTSWTTLSTQLSWAINFTSAANNVITTTATYANSTYATETVTSPQHSNVWILPIYLRAMDKAGNVQDYTFYLNVDPDGDKPIASISYPSSGTTLGGSIRIFGSAIDNVSVQTVWMEIDTNMDGKYDSTDIAALTAAGYAKDGSITDGFKLNGTASWSKTINESKEFNAPKRTDSAQTIISGVRYKIVTLGDTDFTKLGAPKAPAPAGGAEFTATANGDLNSGTGTVSPLTNLIQFRVRACDDKGTYGTWSAFNTINIDNLAPRIGSTMPLKLVQYSDVNLTKVAAEQAYVSNMYIRGEWYLVGSVEDENGITAISVSGSAGGTLVSQKSWFVEGDVVGSYHNYTLRIPVGKALTDKSCGAQTYDIYVEDGSNPAGTTSQPVTLNYDNKDPDPATPTHGGTAISKTNLVVQSNNTYTFSSTVTEADKSDSGFSRLVFFFVREKPTDTTKNRLYNPMLPINSSQSDDDVNGNRTYLSELKWDKDDVPRLLIPNATRSSEDSLSDPLIVGNENVRIGGLVRIAGVDRLIKTVDSAKGEITFSPSVSKDYVEASLLYGLVVDNTTVEVGVWNGSKWDITNDDGDKMVESVVKSGGTWTWDASVNSKNIPDGPIYLYYVAYDKAGNSKSGYVESSVENSGPRITKVQLGTDLSGDGLFDTTEVSTVYTATSGSEPTRVDIKDKTFKMKGDLAVIPEFVGGVNGPLSYVWTANTSDATAWDGTSYRATKVTKSEAPLTTFPGVKVSTTSYAYGLKLSATDARVTPMNGALKLFSFTVWDSTDERDSGTDSQWALINVPINVAVTDAVEPEVKIDEFYWASLQSNSVYGTSAATTDPSTLSGHIELHDDLSATKFDKTSGENDRDPKVSGKITITGSAFDDQRLDSLWVTFDGFTPAANTYLDSWVNLSADKKNGDGKTYYKMAEFDKSKNAWAYAATVPTMTNDSYTFTVTPDYLTQAGHRVTWNLCIDTAAIKDSVALDARVRVIARDRALSPSSYNTVTASNVPYYQMDVVPYIMGVKTNLSTLQKTTSSVYDRTGLGHYPVNADGNAHFYGFNLAKGATVTDLAANTATLGDADAKTFLGCTVYPAAVSTFKSGFVSVSVPIKDTNGTVISSVESLNNKNDNDVKGSFTGTTSSVTGNYGVYSSYYNRQPNNANNNTLTDDVVLDVWKVKKSARSSSGTLTEPIMRIVPGNDVLRFAFANGADRFSMAPDSTTTTSYQDWQKNYADFNNIAFIYDSAGNSYGIATGLDTYPDATSTLAGRLTFISSRWGVCDIDGTKNGSWGENGMNDNYYGYHKLRLEAIGIMKGAYVQGAKLGDDYIMDTRRFSSPTLATADHGGGSTSVYLAYYDKFQKQIRFRYGTFNTTTGTPAQTGLNHNAASSGGFGQFLDQHGQADVNKSSDPYYHDDKYAFDAASDDYSLIAGMNAATGVSTGKGTGKYVAIDVVPGNSAAKDVVVAVWYDGSDLQYSYKLNPYSDYDADLSHDKTALYWSVPQTIFTGGGKYCAIKVDSAKGIHIAAQDSSSQDLKYAYLPLYNAEYSESKSAVTVDAYSIVGTQIQIDTETELVNGIAKVIPYISYYNGATLKPKMAYLVPQDTMDYTAAGADSATEKLTGKWEVTLIPTSSEVQDDHMNIGLWKTTGGAQRTDTPTTVKEVVNASTGSCYGNGTVNPVVGYATVDGTQGYIETAQKQ